MMRAGQFAEVGQLFGAVDAVQRLQELGFRPGAAVEMVQPGNPCIVRVAGAKFCFRHGEMGGVFVRQCVFS
jgi:Fe2+ transport system protein FeoA